MKYDVVVIQLSVCPSPSHLFLLDWVCICSNMPVANIEYNNYCSCRDAVDYSSGLVWHASMLGKIEGGDRDR